MMNRRKKQTVAPPTYQLLTLADGQTVPVMLPPGFSADVVINGRKATHKHDLPIDHSQYVGLRERAKTHTLKFDTISGKIMATPKKPKTPETD